MEKSVRCSRCGAVNSGRICGTHCHKCASPLFHERENISHEESLKRAWGESRSAWSEIERR
jgi:hypothetical protein